MEEEWKSDSLEMEIFRMRYDGISRGDSREERTVETARLYDDLNAYLSEQVRNLSEHNMSSYIGTGLEEEANKLFLNLVYRIEDSALLREKVEILLPKNIQTTIENARQEESNNFLKKISREIKRGYDELIEKTTDMILDFYSE